MASGAMIAVETCATIEGRPQMSWVFLITICTDVGTVEKLCIDSHEAIKLLNEKVNAGEFTFMPSREFRDLSSRIGITLEVGKQSITLESIEKYQQFCKRTGLDRVNG